jgi:hypothetical protein
VDADRLARGVGVVEGHGEGRALVAVAAVGPVEVLGVEPLEGGVRRLRRRACSRGRPAARGRRHSGCARREEEAHGRRDRAEHQGQHQQPATSFLTGCPRGP